MRSICLGLALCLVLIPVGVRADFTPQDLYMLQTNFESQGYVLLRVNLGGGAQSAFVDLPQASYRPTMAFDPVGQKIYLCDFRTTGGLTAIDEFGAITNPQPALTTPTQVAARGDGLVYAWVRPHLYAIDTFNVAHQVMDATGTVPFQLDEAFDEMIYEPGTGALFGLVADDGVGITCPDFQATCAVKLPLRTDGLGLDGSISYAQVEVSQFEYVAGAGLIPGGGILVVVDTNTNDAEPRMQLLDPVNMTFSTYASSGYYIGAAAIMAGTYSTGFGTAVIAVNRVGGTELRSYGLGSSGDGVVVATGLGNGTRCQLLEITTPAVTAAPLVSSGWSLRTEGRNPFAGSTTLAFEAPRAGRAKLAIYDVAGRLVRSIADEWLAPGSHSALWDGRDDAGRRVPAGVYYGRLSAEGDVRSQKLLLLR